MKSIYENLILKMSSFDYILMLNIVITGNQSAPTNTKCRTCSGHKCFFASRNIFTKQFCCPSHTFADLQFRFGHIVTVAWVRASAPMTAFTDLGQVSSVGAKRMALRPPQSTPAIFITFGVTFLSLAAFNTDGTFLHFMVTGFTPLSPKVYMPTSFGFWAQSKGAIYSSRTLELHGRLWEISQLRRMFLRPGL